MAIEERHTLTLNSDEGIKVKFDSHDQRLVIKVLQVPSGKVEQEVCLDNQQLRELGKFINYLDEVGVVKYTYPGKEETDE